MLSVAQSETALSLSLHARATVIFLARVAVAYSKLETESHLYYMHKEHNAMQIRL